MKTPTSIAGKVSSHYHQAGFSYLMLLIFIFVISLSTFTASTLSSVIIQKEKEIELLFRGQAYTKAIESYYSVSNTYPRSLDELVNDSRFANRHYLRKLYQEPFEKEWILLKADDGGIKGVASKSQKLPFKKADFPNQLKSFEEAKTYSDWKFIFIPIAKKI